MQGVNKTMNVASFPFPFLLYFLSCNGNSIHKNSEEIKLYHVAGIIGSGGWNLDSSNLLW